MTEVIAVDPELTEGQGDRDGQEDELVAGLPSPLCSCAGRRIRKPVCIHKQIPDVAGGVHVGKDDLVTATTASCSGTQVMARPRWGA